MLETGSTESRRRVEVPKGPDRFFPERYAPGELDFEVRIAFESKDGALFAGPGMKLIAGACGTWVIEVTSNERDLRAGAKIAFMGFNCQFAYRFQSADPKRRDYVSLETESEAELAVIGGGPTRNICDVLVRSGVFRRGESFTVRLGDRRQGSVGSEVYWTATHGRILTAVDVNGGGRFLGIKGGPFDFEVIAHHEPKLIRVLGPTVVAVGEAFALHLGVFDRNRNVIEAFEGEVNLRAPDGLRGIPETVQLSADDGGLKVLEGVVAERPGVYRIEASRDSGTDSHDTAVVSVPESRTFTSNPIVVEEQPSHRVYWGDVHAHGWGDCSMYFMHLRTPKLDPAGRHWQARHVGRLDFACPGPMSLPFEERHEIWRAYVEAYAQLDGRDDYVPFLSYEAHPRGPGDRQVIFKALEPPPSLDCFAPMQDVDAQYGARDDVMLEVHIGGAPPRWDEYHTDRERMVEVASGFGCAEWLLQRALRLGYRPAACGGSDLHLGLMGGPRAVEPLRGRFGQKCPMNVRDSAYGTGPLTAIVAPALQREALWGAIKERHTYATSGARAYLEFRCNGELAGGEVNAADGVTVSIRCHACAEMDRVDLICGRFCLQSWFPKAMDFRAEATFAERDLPGEWLYVRVHQVDSEYLWSSPVWLRRKGDLPAAGDLPAWNEDEELDFSHVPANEATPYLEELLAYLATEEDPSLFHDVTPMEVVRGSMGTYALFFCHYGEARRRMAIRWFFEFEIPKIRFDWGWRDFGAADEFEVEKELGKV